MIVRKHTTSYLVQKRRTSLNTTHLSLKEEMTRLMNRIPQGTEQIRRYKNEEKWVSSDHKLASPGSKSALKETMHTVAIENFEIAKYPVTVDLYNQVMEMVPQ